MAHAKVDSVHLKKLDDRSQALVHLGIEPGSKAYRLYNPNTKRIVVSRDVIFDEKEAWNWKGADEEENNSGNFHMKWGTTIDEGHGPFVIGSHQQESIAEETEQQETETEPSHTEGTSQEAATQGTRRSTRQTSKPNYLDDYILLAEVEWS